MAKKKKWGKIGAPGSAKRKRHMAKIRNKKRGRKRASRKSKGRRSRKITSRKYPRIKVTK